MSALKVTQTEDILLDFCSLMPLRKTGNLVKVGGQRYILGTQIRKGKNRKISGVFINSDIKKKKQAYSVSNVKAGYRYGCFF